MDKLHVITTGGTIEGLDYDTSDNSHVQPTVSIQNFFKAANVKCNYNIEKAFQKDSRFITDQDRLELAEKIATSDCNYILITHGTLTMTDTAKFIGPLAMEKVIVLVGALILGSEKNTDAPFNLGFAIGSVKHLKSGVYIAMHGRIFSWDNVRKNFDENLFEEEF